MNKKIKSIKIKCVFEILAAACYFNITLAIVKIFVLR